MNENSTNIIFYLGVLFGAGIYFNTFLAIPCSILLFTVCLQTLDYTKKSKKELTEQLNNKLIQFEKLLGDNKAELHLIKSELDTLKVRSNMNGMFGSKP